MQTNHTTSPSATDSNRLREVVRFGIVGAVATLLQYGLYVLLNRLVHPTLANTIAYALSFAFSHLINYTLQTATLALMLWLGLPKDLALIPVFAICVPINFILVRYFLKKQ